MPPALAGACLRWAPMAASISVSVALQFHLLTAAGKKAQQKVNIHLYRAPLLMLQFWSVNTRKKDFLPIILCMKTPVQGWGKPNFSNVNLCCFTQDQLEQLGSPKGTFVTLSPSKHVKDGHNAVGHEPVSHIWSVCCTLYP